MSSCRCVLVPTMVKQLETASGNPVTVRQVAAGYFHCLALAVDGSVYCWGANETSRSKACSGRLGIGTAMCAPKPTLLRFDGLVESGHVIAQISAGHSHSAAVTDDGNVWIWGILRNPLVRDDETFIPTGYIAFPQRLHGLQVHEHVRSTVQRCTAFSNWFCGLLLGSFCVTNI